MFSLSQDLFFSRTRLFFYFKFTPTNRDAMLACYHCQRHVKSDAIFYWAVNNKTRLCRYSEMTENASFWSDFKMWRDLGSVYRKARGGWGLSSQSRLQCTTTGQMHKWISSSLYQKNSGTCEIMAGMLLSTSQMEILGIFFLRMLLLRKFLFTSPV